METSGPRFSVCPKGFPGVWAGLSQEAAFRLGWTQRGPGQAGALPTGFPCCHSPGGAAGPRKRRARFQLRPSFLVPSFIHGSDTEQGHCWRKQGEELGAWKARSINTGASLFLHSFTKVAIG